MTPTPPLRPTFGSADVEPAAVLRTSSPVRAAAAVAAAAAVFLAVAMLAGVGRFDAGVPGFLDEALGPEKAEAPLERTPATGVDVRIHDQGYTVSHRGKSVSIVSEHVGGAEWQRHVHGVTRETDFGTETIVVGGPKTEEFLTVVERQGEKTWRWKLATRLLPRLGRGGEVAFLDPTRQLVTSLAIDPVRILDTDGEDVTPEGLSWGLEEDETGWWLTLELDDAALPLPYVIDPAVTHRTSATQNNGAGSTSLTITKPAGTAEKDLLIAHVTVRNTGTITAPTGWTQAVNATYSFYLRQSVWYKVATASEPANYTWTFGTSGAAAGGISAFYGIKTSTAPGPLNVADTTPQTANSNTVTAATITTTTNNALVLAFFSARLSTAFTQATGMTELYEAAASGGLSVATDSMTQVTAGATGAKTSTITSGRNSGTQASFNVDDVAPSGSLTDPGSPLAGTVTLTGTASDADSAVSSVVFQRSPAGQGNWTAIGTDTTSPYSVAFATTGVTDGLYDLRVVVTDAAGNVTNSATVANRRVDNTAPATTSTFPASAGTYNTAGWNAGCGTIGFCGTYSDGGSGVSQVQISVRQGTANYWNGSGFSSVSEVWNTAAIAGGNWSYAFAAASFPADGSYTIRVRATDAAGNVEAPNSRSFTIDRVEPDTNITSNPANPTASTSAAFTFSSDEGGSTFECRLDGGAWGACTSPKGYATLADGSHTFDVRAIDVAGNTDASPATYTWLVDTTSPSSTTAFPTASGEYNVTGWDAGCGTAGLCGTYSDGVGSGVSQVQISVRQGTANYWNSSGFSSVSEVWNTAAIAGGNWSYAFAAGSFPADGDYTVRVRAVDTAGNSETPSSRSFTFDSTEPETAIDSTMADPTNSTSASFDFSADEPGSTFACALDGGAWGACTSPKEYTGLVDGSHTFEVRATDVAGNTDSNPASFSWTIDTVAPSSTAIFPAAGGNYTAAEWDAGCATVGLCGTYSDTGTSVVGVEVSIRQGSGDYWDGSAFTSSTETWNAATLAGGNWSYAFELSDFPADGSYTVRIRARDDAGNTETPSSRTFELDATDPSGSLTAPADGSFVTATVAVSSDSADGGSAVESAEFQHRPAGGGTWTTIDTDTTAPYSVSWDTTSLGDGDYELHVITSDQAGNTFTSPTRTVTVDNTGPTAPVVTLGESSPYAHVNGAEIFLNTGEAGSYDVSATSSDAQSGIDKIRFPGGLDDSSSPYKVTYGFGDLSGVQTVTAFNGVGLFASNAFTVTPDTSAPTGGSVDYADGYDADGDVTITVDDGADALSGVAPASAVLERRTSSLSDGSCDPFAGGWSAVTSPSTVASGLCAQYRYRVSDRVGNEALYSSGNVVKVDLVDPAVPALTLDESSPYAHVAGSEIFLNTSETGSFDVQASTGDPVSGIDKVVFPGGVEDASAPYAAIYDFDDLLGSQTVTAHDRAGNTSSSDFDVTEDVSAPTTTDDTASIGSAWLTAPVTVTLTPSDIGSGVAATYYTTDGSIPTTSSDEGVSIDLTADGVYVIRYFSVDNVGNVEPVRSAATTIRIDKTNPSVPTIMLDESSPYAHAAGAEIFVNTSQTGSYDVSATTSDAGSGIDRVVFPGGVEDSSSPYSAIYDLDDLTGFQTVSVHDVAGNTASDTFTVTPDTSAPTGGSVDYPDGYHADGIVTVTFDSGTDALSGVDASSGALERRTSALVGGTCDPFVGGWTPVTSPDTVPDLTCAQYRHRVSDRVGNEAVYTLPSSTVKVDLTAPQTAIDAAPSDPSADASPSFEFSSSEGGSTFECRLDGGPWAACSSPQGYAGLADGSHDFQVRATDAVGLTDPTPASHSWTVDTSAPNTSFDDVPADPSNDDAPTFEFSASEGGSTFECRLDGGPWTVCSSPETIDPVADDSHTFQVRAVDAAGNADSSPASHTWTVDTVAPNTSFDDVPANPSSDETPTFEFSASEGGSTFECRLDGEAWGACTSPATVGPLAEGSHTFAVRATDAADNVETTPESYTWVVDASPSVSITQPSTFVNGSDSDPYAVRATSPDGDVSGIEFFSCSNASVDCAGGTWVSLGTDVTPPYEASWPLDPDGNRALRAVVTDAASFTGSDVVNITIDRTAPATTIDTAPSDPASSTGASIEFSSSEGGSTFECRLDGDAWDACSSPQGYTGLSEGNHTFDVRATDAAGNVDPTPASSGWTVDTAAPETTIDATPSNPAAGSAPSFEFSASEGGASFECRLDSGAWEACSSPHGYTGLAEGSHTFRVRATDPAGNVDDSPATHTWTIDSTAPGGSLTDPGQFLGGTVTLTAAASDGGAGVQSVDFQISPASADSWTSIEVDASAPYSVDWDTTALADGAYDLRIVVTDNVGNSGSSALVEDRIVDNTAPTKPLGFKGTVSGRTFSLSWKPASDNSGAVSAYQIYANGALVTTVGGSSLSAPMGPFRLTDTRTFQVAAVDGAGNVGALSLKLKIVPKLTKLTLAAAKKALKKRGFKVGKITSKASPTILKGRVIAGTAKGLRRAGLKIGLIVSKGKTAR